MTKTDIMAGILAEMQNAGMVSGYVIFTANKGEAERLRAFYPGTKVVVSQYVPAGQFIAIDASAGDWHMSGDVPRYDCKMREAREELCGERLPRKQRRERTHPNSAKASRRAARKGW